MARKNQYVVRHPEGWAVKGEGNRRATRVFVRQWEAIEFGVEVVKNQRSILIICNRKGVERDRKDYRNYQPYNYSYSSYSGTGSLDYTPQPASYFLGATQSVSSFQPRSKQDAAELN
jgi:Uncharacterized protein conserved in bacteria (DUF2188)